jgi:hypothetical protein
VVLYRWEADERTGFVTFEVEPRRFRPADDGGKPIGDLRYDPAAGDPSGTAAGVHRGLFNQTQSIRSVSRIPSACAGAGQRGGVGGGRDAASLFLTLRARSMAAQAGNMPDQ